MNELEWVENMLSPVGKTQLLQISFLEGDKDEKNDKNGNGNKRGVETVAVMIRIFVHAEIF